MSEIHNHIEAMCQMLGIPFDKDVGIRQTKEKIMEIIGISKGTTTAQKEVFFVKDNPTENQRLLDYITAQTQGGNYLSLLVMRDRFSNSGGCPVVYVADEVDIEKKLVLRNGKIIEVIAQDGQVITINNESQINSYARRRSDIVTLGEFDNHKGKRDVRFGGGFRLQVDDLSVDADILNLVVSGIFSFEDRGSRVLALESQEDMFVPRYSDTFKLSYEHGMLRLPIKKPTTTKDVAKSQSAKDASQLVMEKVFVRDGQAITNLLRILLTLSPRLKLHQLEGMYGVHNNTVNPEIIDFDGLDGLDSARSLKGDEIFPQLTPVERLVKAQLAMGEFLCPNPLAQRYFLIKYW